MGLRCSAHGRQCTKRAPPSAGSQERSEHTDPAISRVRAYHVIPLQGRMRARVVATISPQDELEA